MIVRRGGGADVEALAALRGIDRDQVAWFARWMDTRTGTHLAFVVEVDGSVVGAAWLLVAERVPREAAAGRWFGDVQSVMVLQEHRNRGVGGALISAILAEARALDLEHVTVHSGRRAVGFSVRHGFSPHRQMLIWEP